MQLKVLVIKNIFEWGYFLKKIKEKVDKEGIMLSINMGNYNDKEDPMSKKRISFEDRLKKHPYLKTRFESILDIAEDKSGNPDKADDAEQYLIDEIS